MPTKPLGITVEEISVSIHLQVFRLLVLFVVSTGHCDSTLRRANLCSVWIFRKLLHALLCQSQNAPLLAVAQTIPKADCVCKLGAPSSPSSRRLDWLLFTTSLNNYSKPVKFKSMIWPRPQFWRVDAPAYK